MPQPTKAAPEGFEVDTGVRFKRAPRDAGTDKANAKEAVAASSAKGRPALSEALLKELKRSLPAIPNSKIIEPLKATPHSRLARMALCVDQDVAKTTEAMVSAFKRKKWGDLIVNAPKGNANYRSFTGNSERFRVNGSTSQGDFPKCKTSLKQSRVSLSFSERQPASSLKKAEALLDARQLPEKSMGIAPTPQRRVESKTGRKGTVGTERKVEVGKKRKVETKSEDKPAQR